MRLKIRPQNTREIPRHSASHLPQLHIYLNESTSYRSYKRIISSLITSAKTKISSEMASSSTAYPTVRLHKAGRAKLAKETINKTVPYILKTNKRARSGAENSELLFYTQAVSPKGHRHAPSSSRQRDIALTSSQPLSAKSPEPPTDGENIKAPYNIPVDPETKPPRIRVIQSDTYDAAEVLAKSPTRTPGRTAVLNMASAMKPGGGVLNGSLAQEESLCLRSTLYASLRDSFYRIPETAAVYTPDVLVFRSSDNNRLPEVDSYFVDVISCAAIKGPDVVHNEHRGVVYGEDGDYEKMLMKIRLIFQIAKEKGVTCLVLGALGCGAYKNPPAEVAKIFKKVILGDRKRAGIDGIEEIVFAIFDDGENLRIFKDILKDVVSE
jgi:uncharacterized protein (TIGR02452 family)